MFRNYPYKLCSYDTTKYRYRIYLSQGLYCVIVFTNTPSPGTKSRKLSQRGVSFRLLY